MEKKKILEKFFAQYGSKITRLDKDGETFGILAPVNQIDSKTQAITFETMGFTPKSEFVLLSSESNHVIEKNARLQIEEKIYKVIQSDFCMVSGKPFYARSYLFEMRSVCI